MMYAPHFNRIRRFGYVFFAAVNVPWGDFGTTVERDSSADRRQLAFADVFDAEAQLLVEPA
jgi:hypothetical protein